MTSRKDRIGASYELRTYIMYELYEYILSDFTMSRYDSWVCMWIEIMDSMWVYLKYVEVLDPTRTLYK